jgi:EAL domain-containing protein (putative c-di-GMP-specific phosphodiesterase class I)
MSKSKKLQDQAVLPKAMPAPHVQATGGMSTSDVLVLLAMAVAAVAVGSALYLQAGWAMIPAASAAAGAFVAAAIMHAQLMRIRSLEQVVDANAGEAAAAEGPPAPAQAVRVPRLQARREPTLPRPDAEFIPEDLDRATDHHAGQLSLVAAALRDAEPARSRRLAAAEPELELASEEPGGWAEPGAVDALVRQYAEELDRSAQAQAVPQPTAPEPTLPNVTLRATPPTPRLPSLPLVPAAATQESILAAAIRKAADGDIEIHLQPVVAFGDRKARLYEVFPKIADGKGKVLSLADYHPTATTLGLALAMERAAILRCCSIQRSLSEKGRARAMIVRLSHAAIHDRAFLQRLLTDMKADPLLTDLMIFEVDQAEIEQGDGAERENMDLLARAGFRFALGNADTLGLEVAELTARRIGFVRISAALLAAEGNPSAVGELRQGAIETILTGIVTEDHARLGQEFGLILGQGSLFSEAKPLRADVVKAGEARVA